MTHDYQEQVRARVLDEANFVSLTMKGQIRDVLPYRQVTARPVLLKNRRHLQFSHFTAKQDITKNYLPDEVTAHLDELLALPFQSIVVRSTTGDLTVQITKKGKAIIHQSGADQTRAPELTHDSRKDL